MKQDDYKRRLERRIASKLAPAGSCLEWTGRRDPDGYGVTWACESVTGQPPNNRRVHRVVWALTHGPIADEVLVLHRCDNPPCGRLDHLFVGDHTTNMRDKSAKGRWRGNPLRRVDLICENCQLPFTVQQHRAATARFHSLQCKKEFYK